jgi:hypothetical protein
MFGGNGASDRYPSFGIESGSNSYFVTSQQQADVGSWYHIVGVKSGRFLYLYVNGQLVNTKDVGSVLQVNNASGRNLHIGWIVTELSGKTIVDEARVYSRALSSSDVSSLYTNNRSPLLDSVYSHGQESGADIRFRDSDDTTLLNYWIEKFTASGQNGKIWVKVPSLPANTSKNIYAYYGSAGAAGSSGKPSDLPSDHNGVIVTIGPEIAAISSTGTWESPVDSNVIDLLWNGGWGDGTAGSTAFSATVANVDASNTITFMVKTAANVSALSSASYVAIATASANTSVTVTKSQLDALGIGSGTNRYVQMKAVFAQSSGISPKLDKFTLFYLSDNTAPETNATGISMLKNAGGLTVASNGWTNTASPYFSWTAGSDSQSGLKGYCLYLGTDASGDPAAAKGLLGTSPVATSGTSCQFIISATSVDFVTSSYKGTSWLSTSSSPYYLTLKAIDSNNNVSGTSTQFPFRFDNTAPVNASSITCSAGSSNVVEDLSFIWPVSGSTASSDDNAGVLGFQYQLNSKTGTWLGSSAESTVGIGKYIPIIETSRTLTTAQDGPNIISGYNTVYFRTVDAAGNVSLDEKIRSCVLSYGSVAPVFGQTDVVTVSPSTSTTNSFSLSWPAAAPSNGRTIAHYYYMINTTPPATYSMVTGNASTYIDAGTKLTIPATALSNINKGSNTVSVVAVDDKGNYAPGNYISGTFTVDISTPDNVGNLVATDSSIKSQSQWNVTLSYTAPSYKAAGDLTYIIKRSMDNITFTEVKNGVTGLSYVDNVPSSALYYYKVYTKDGSGALSSGTNAVSITPIGKWTTPPTLDSGPTVGSITTKKATITWRTSRSADSKVQYGTSSGSYGNTEPSDSDQVSSHTIQLSGLNPGTTYYFKAKWKDADGNTGITDEKTFTTAQAPTVKDPKVKSISLNTAVIQYVVTNASSVKIYYGTTSSLGSSLAVSTSTSETTYTSELNGLLDGIKYYYKINTFDADGSEYDGSILTFETLPRPKISNVHIQQVSNSAQSSVLVTWTTNTSVSSIVTYYPEQSVSDARDEVNVALISGDHRMIIKGLSPETDYLLTVKGRDSMGNEAISDTQKITTAIDTRPPQISDLHVESSSIPSISSLIQEHTAQIVVSWNTDEPATSQIEFGDGTGTSYTQKTLEESNLTINHIVILSNLTLSKVYHMRVISKDKAGNAGISTDAVAITQKSTENVLNLVITNLGEVFGFLEGLTK